GARGHSAIHAHAFMISAVPLAPPVALGGFHSGPVMTSENVGQGLQAEWARVALIDSPRIDLHFRKSPYHSWIVSKRQPCPFFSDGFRTQIWIPRQAPETVEIGHRQWMAEPALVHANIGNAHESYQRTTKCFAGNNDFYRSSVATQLEVEVKHLFPHRWQKTQMPLRSEERRVGKESISGLSK